LAESELEIVNVEVLAPLEQLPSACEALTSIIGQSTVALVNNWRYKRPNEPEVDEDLYLHDIAEPCGTLWVSVVDAFFATDWFAAFWVQFEPPSNEYSTKKYAVVLAEFELAKVNVEVFAPAEQLPSAWDTLISITGQSTVALADIVVGVNPVKSPLVSEEVTLQVIAELWVTDCWKIDAELLFNVALALLVVQFEPPSNEYSTLI